MKDFLVPIITGLIVAFLASKLGFGGSSTVHIRGGSGTPRTGKNIMIFSVLIIVTGLVWANKTHVSPGTLPPGYGLAICGLVLYTIGSVIAWYQKN